MTIAERWGIAVQTLLVETLKVWREAERVLQELPPVEPAHETVRQLVIQLREAYASLSEQHDLPADAIEAIRAQIESARQVLRDLFPETSAA
jgi:hypothetical protein